MNAAAPNSTSARRRRTAALAEAVRAGERAGVARALNLLDDKRPASRALAHDLLAALPAPEQRLDTHLVGFTGPPGAGKSTLISAVINHWRRTGSSVAVAAVDPSSPVSGGALLGDRLRMQVAPDDNGVFIRSLASRRAFGGLAAELLPMLVVMLAAFDRVVVETVGVGQREVDVSLTADTTCLVVQPGAGDSVQFLKAGIMEVPDILIVNKSDLGVLAEHARDELRASISADDARTVLTTSARDGAGIDELVAAMHSHHASQREHRRLAASRRRAQATWIVNQLREEFGTHGLAGLGGERALNAQLCDSTDPLLGRLPEFRNRLLSRFGADQTSNPAAAAAARH